MTRAIREVIDGTCAALLTDPLTNPLAHRFAVSGIGLAVGLLI